jgi:hypothetical protein
MNVTTPSGSHAEGECPDLGVSFVRRFGRVLPPKPSTAASATDVSDDTALEHRSVFTHSPSLWNAPKHNTVENVHMNYLVILSEPAQSGNAGNGLHGGSTAVIPVTLRQGPFAVIW